MARLVVDEQSQAVLAVGTNAAPPNKRSGAQGSRHNTGAVCVLAATGAELRHKSRPHSPVDAASHTAGGIARRGVLSRRVAYDFRAACAAARRATGTRYGEQLT